jgi:hypothetical protein
MKLIENLNEVSYSGEANAAVDSDYFVGAMALFAAAGCIEDRSVL